MKQINYNNKTYNIPESYEDVTLGMHIAAENLVETIDTPELNSIAIMSAYTDLPISLIKAGKTQEIIDVYSTLMFVNTSYLPVDIDEFEFEGHTYYIKPTLEKGEFQDWLAINTILHNNQDFPQQGLPRLIAVLAKREGETMDSYDLDEREILFRNLPLPIALNIKGFFLSNYEQLKLNFLLSSQAFKEELIQLKFQELRNLINKLKEQSGCFSLLRLQITLLLIWMWFTEKRLVRFFSGTSSKNYKLNFKKTWQRLMQRLQGKNVSK